MEVRRAFNDQTVFIGPVTQFDNGETEGASGDRGWWFDFSELAEAGSYQIYDHQNQERTGVFKISENPYLHVLKAAGRMFFHNRCNFPKEAPFAETYWTGGQNFLNPLQDANCRYGRASLLKTSI